MARLRELLSQLRRLRGSPRALTVTGVVAVLLVAALLDVPGRLGELAPSDSPTVTPAARATSTPTAAFVTDPGELTSLTNADNRELDRCTPGSATLARCGPAPALAAGTWLNTRGGDAVNLAQLRGSVVLVEFFSGSCVSCRRDSRYLNAWQERYGDAGLQIVGVHSPEFDFEKDIDQLARTLDEFGVPFPVLQDEASSTLSEYRSEVLPSMYLVDAGGTVRAISFGGGGAFRVEAQIRKLLAERLPDVALPAPIGELDDGEDAEPGTTEQINLGDSRGRRYDNESDTISGGGDRFRLPPHQPEGTFSLGGAWQLGTQDAVPGSTGVARVAFRGRLAYQLVSGSGSLVVTSSDGTVRRIPVSGGPELRQITGTSTFGPQTLTIRYEGDLRVYAFSFG